MTRKLTFLTLLAALLLPLGAKAQTAITEFPYLQGFEDGLNGWTVIDDDGDGYNWEVFTAASNIPAHTGSHTIVSRSYYPPAVNPDNWLVSPAIVLDDTVRQLSWWHKTQDPSYPSEHYAVYISTTGNTVDDFTDDPVYERTLTAADAEWVLTTVSLADYEGETIYVAFRHYNCFDMFYFHIDDIAVEAAAGCQPPSGLAFENITSTSADMTFDMPSCATNGVRFLVNGVEQEPLTSGSYSFTGLTPGTVYTIHLYSLCGDDDTSFAVTEQFMTECVNITVPYHFDFEDDHANCYAYEHMYWRTEATYPHTGSYSFYSSACPDHYVVTPIIEAPEADQNAIFEFFALPSGGSISFKLYVSTNASLTFDSTFIVVMDTTLTGSTYQDVRLSLIPYAGQNITIAIEHTANGTMYIDDIMVRNTLAPVVTLPATTATNINTPLTIAATLTDGVLDGMTYAWTSAMEAAGDATMTATDSVLSITYTAVGIDTVTVTATNAHGTSTATMYVRAIDLAPITEYPYSTGFEAGQDISWLFENGTNAWYIDSAAHHYGNHALYISSDNGATNSYNVSTASVSYAYRAFNVTDAGDYAISFDWMANGESSFDYLRAFVAPGSTEFTADVLAIPEDAILLDAETGRLNQSSTWQRQQQIVSIATPGLYLLTFAWRNDPSLGTNPPAAIDSVTIAPLSCNRPLSLVIDNVTADTIAFHWVPAGEEESWVVTLDSVNYVVTESSYTAEGLAMGVYHTISVRALCGEGDTSFSYDTTVATLRSLVAADLPFTTDFEADEVDTTWLILNGANGWYIDSAAHHTGSHALYISADSGATNSYITSGTPSTSYAIHALNLTQAGDYAISFDWQAYGEGSYDYIRVFLAPGNMLFMPDELYTGLSYSALPTGCIALDGGTKLNLSSSWQTKEQIVSIAAAGVYQLVFLWRNDNSTGTQPPAAIDNIEFAMLTCPKPANLEVDTTTADTIAFHWSPRGEETSWVVTVATDSAVVVDNAIVTDTFYMVEGLEPNTPYTVSVRALCDEGDTSFSLTSIIRTECGAITLPYFESFEDGGETCWRYAITNASNTVSLNTYTAADGAKSLRLYMYSSGSRTYAILPALDNVNTLMMNFSHYDYYDENNVIEVGTIADPQNINSFVSLFSTIGTDSWTEEEVRFNADTTGNRYIAFRATGATSYTYVLIDAITVMVAPSCARPEGVSVSNVTTNGADVVIDDTTLVNNYHVIVVSGTDTVVDAMATDTVYTLTGLEANTAYVVTVNAVCDDGTATSSRTTSFRTDCEGGNCEFTVAMVDSYGDGWNGNAINVWQNGSVYENLTITSGSNNTVTVRPCLGDPVALIWQTGSYAYEASFSITDASDSILLVGSGSDYTTGDTLLIFDGACNASLPSGVVDTIPDDTTLVCDAPAIVAATPTQTSITLVWTGAAAEFEVAIVEGTWQTPANVTTTSAHNYVFNGLTAATQYTVGVRTICDDTVSTWTTRSLSTTQATDTTDTNSIALAAQLNFSLYPNPASSVVTVVAEGKVLVAVLDLNGRELIRTEEKTFSVEGLAKGAYFVRLTSEEGTAVRKLIVR